jgi:hypothetical protein
VKVRTKRARAVRENLKKAAIWLFLLVFVASIAGVTLVTATAR